MPLNCVNFAQKPRSWILKIKNTKNKYLNYKTKKKK